MSTLQRMTRELKDQPMLIEGELFHVMSVNVVFNELHLIVIARKWEDGSAIELTTAEAREGVVAYKTQETVKQFLSNPTVSSLKEMIGVGLESRHMTHCEGGILRSRGLELRVTRKGFTDCEPNEFKIRKSDLLELLALIADEQVESVTLERAYDWGNSVRDFAEDTYDPIYQIDVITLK